MIRSTSRTHRDKFKYDDVDASFELAGFDYNVIAQQIKASREIVRKDKRKEQLYTSPKLENISNAIIGVRVTDTIEGSSTLVVDLSDPDFELLEFFDIDKDGKLDKIELQYPPGSASWWRLTGLGISTQAGQALTISMTFMERPAVLLLHKRGPKKTSRGKVTRAEFLRSCVKDVKLHPLKFRSQELHVKQQVAGRQPVDPDAGLRVVPVEPSGTPRPAPPKRVEEREREHDKSSGLHKGDDVTVKGKKATTNQITQAERALDVAKELHAPHDAAVALIMTAIGESNLGAAMDNPKSVYGGVFAGSPENFPDQGDTEAMAEACLKGGKGFNAPEGGLIGGVKAMKSNTGHGGGSYRSLGHLCYVNQGNRSNFGSDKDAEDFFADHESEAENWVQAYGDGFSGGSSYYRAQYNFQIGDEENPKERYWDGMRALAEEVRWRLFIDGRTIYFDSDMTLIRQKPAAIIRRTAPEVLGFDATWDGERDLATEMQLELICEPFAFRAGQVFKLQGFGPLSNGSTALPKGLPGRWLIWEIDRSSSSYSSTFTLRQPERERMEPNTDQQREREDHGSSGGSLRDVDDGMTPRDIIDELVLPIARKHNAKNPYGQPLTSASVAAANSGHSQNVSGSGNTSWHKGNGTDMWAADLSYAGSDVGHVNPDGDGLADELARKFGFQQRSNHIYAFDQNVSKDGVSYQLGWRTMVGGNHFTHVHFGAKVTDPSKRHVTGTSSGDGGGPHGTNRP